MWALTIGGLVYNDQADWIKVDLQGAVNWKLKEEEDSSLRMQGLINFIKNLKNEVSFQNAIAALIPFETFKTREELTCDVEAAPLAFLGEKENELLMIFGVLEQVGENLRINWRVDNESKFERLNNENSLNLEGLIKKAISHLTHLHIEGLYPLRVFKKKEEVRYDPKDFFRNFATLSMQSDFCKVFTEAEEKPMTIENAIQEISRRWSNGGSVSRKVMDASIKLFNYLEGSAKDPLFLKPWEVGQMFLAVYYGYITQTLLNEQGVLAADIYVSAYNLSQDPLRATSFSGFSALSMEKYLTALNFGLNPEATDLSKPKKYNLVLSLRRDRPDAEAKYLNKSSCDNVSCDFWLDYIKKLKKESLIIGCDVCGQEDKLAFSEMNDRLGDLRQQGLLYSLHAGEYPFQATAVGLENIIQALDLTKWADLTKLGQESPPFAIGHAVSLWYALTASPKNQILNKQQKESGLEILRLMRRVQIPIQVCLTSNLKVCVDCDINGDLIEEKLAGVEISKRYLWQIAAHPFVVFLLQNGPRAIDLLPPCRLSPDDPLITGKKPIEEIRALVKVLKNPRRYSYLEEKEDFHVWTDLEVCRLFEKVFLENNVFEEALT